MVESGIVAAIEESWARVMAWLAANAPASYVTLNPPAMPAELDACERDLGIALPAELRRLLLVSNGAADYDAAGTYHPEALFLPGDYRLLSAAEMASKSRALLDTAAELGDDLIGSWWHPQWVMVGENNSGWGVALDQRPGPRQGAVGEFMNEGETDFSMWASLGEYVAKLADSLENATDFLCSFEDGSFQRYRPYVGGLEWHAIDEE
jgi:cell wall assembly regulator SMI1